jgi:dTDP-4-dehydrorhamnose 3,5-epimerase-like enzyme
LRNRETGEKAEFDVSGENPTIIDMPLNWTHNIKNTGEEEMGLVVWVNEVFDPTNPDTFAEEVYKYGKGNQKNESHDYLRYQAGDNPFVASFCEA